MTGIEMWVLEKIADLVFEAVKGAARPLAEQRKIKNRVREANAEALQPLLGYFNKEKISREKQERLVEECQRTLLPFTEQPERLFEGSLNGEIIFKKLYSEGERSKNLPQVIQDDETEGLYCMLMPRIADLMCKVPEAVRDWESLSVKETLKRLDEVGEQQRRAAALQVATYETTRRVEETTRRVEDTTRHIDERTERIENSTAHTAEGVDEIIRRLTPADPAQHAPPQQPDTAAEAEAGERQSLTEQLRKATRVLQILKEEAAGYTSLTTPAHKVIEIEGQEAVVRALRARLRAKEEEGQDE